MSPETPTCFEFEFRNRSRSGSIAPRRARGRVLLHFGIDPLTATEPLGVSFTDASEHNEIRNWSNKEGRMTDDLLRILSVARDCNLTYIKQEQSRLINLQY